MKRIITKEKIEQFRKYLLCEEKSAATIEKYIRDIKVFFNWCGSREIGKEDIITYKEQITGSYMLSSVNSMLSSINSFFDFSGWHELRVKTLKIQKQIFSHEERELTKMEYQRLLTAALNRQNKRLYYIMQTICSCGIRISELRFITVEAIRSKTAQVRSKGKSRLVILPSDLCKILREYISEIGIKEGSIFVSRNGKPLSRTNIWADMKKLCESARVPRSKVFPHNLRHLFARTFYSQQKDIVRLADLLGHTSVNTTRIYTIESGRVHQQQIQKLGLIRMRA